MIKNKDERMNITDALDHPWFNQANEEIHEMRKSSNSGEDDMMKFISYSNADSKLAKESIMKLHNELEKTSNGGGGLNHGPGSGNLPGINKLNMVSSAERPNEQDHEMDS